LFFLVIFAFLLLGVVHKNRREVLLGIIDLADHTSCSRRALPYLCPSFVHPNWCRSNIRYDQHVSPLSRNCTGVIAVQIA